MRRERTVVVILITVIFVLWFIKSLFENALNSKGIQLTKLQDQITTYKKENTILKEEYLEGAAYTTIQRKALQRGFVAADYLYLP